MADDKWTIADSIADALDLAENEVSDLLNEAPLVALLPAEKSSNGITHKYTKRTGAPVVGFRSANSGRDMSKSSDALVSVDLKILDWTFAVDKAVADVWRKGGAAAFIAREGLAHVGSALFAYEQQAIYGTLANTYGAITGSAASGFVGMIEAATVALKTAAMSVDAGGTTANGATSVWALRLGANDVMGVYNGDGEIADISETMVQLLPDAEGRLFPNYVTPACTWLALQVGSAYSFGRICNLTAQAGHTLTDDLISQLIQKFPAGKGPTHLVMNRQSLQQLQDSRTATTTTGAPAPFPEESFKVPIVTTDAIVNIEALAA